MKSTILRVALFSLAVSWGLGEAKAPAEERPELSLDELREQRRELARRPRRIIMNNDGCDALYFPKDEEVTVRAFLGRRTTPLADTQVDTIAYCTISSGFSHFTHDTAAGTLLTRSGAANGLRPDMRNVSQDLIDTGTDCLQAVVDFCHEHDKEAFWSMRMNDTHDVAHRPDKPYFLFPPLKEEHAEWLVGNPTDRTPFGRWSSVDYARPEIRDLAYRYIEEVCTNYDVDGVELDFFRHLCYFKSTATGGKADADQRAMMTDLVRRVRRMTEARGIQRGRPILVAVRVPDCVGYCRDMGLDVEHWLEEGLVDLLVTTGYFRLNPWSYSVELGHKHDVAVYPCLSDSRVRGESRFRRSSLESYRGRAMNAWAAGADGLHLFNSFDPNANIWRELGDRDSLRTKDKLYFVHVRNGDPRSYLAVGRDYRTTELLGPSHTRQIKPNDPLQIELAVGEDLAAVEAEAPTVELHLEVPALTSLDQLRVAMNDTPLADGTLREGWVDYAVPLSALRRGTNQITIEATPSTAPGDPWDIVFDGREKPDRGWDRDNGSERTLEEICDGALRIADRGEVSGDYLYYRHPWGADPSGKASVEAQVQVESGSSFIIVTNGTSGERLGLYPDRIELYHHRHLKQAMDTTDGFHRYRLDIDGRDLAVYVDGQLRIDAPAALADRPGYARNEVCFGAANSPMTGQAMWRSVRARPTGLVCRDLVLSVSYGRE